jgi:leucyl-tRNA synthetase
VPRLKKFTKETAATFAQLVAPYAPHSAEEIWEITGSHAESIAYATWPEFNAETLAKDDLDHHGRSGNGENQMPPIDVPADISKDDFLSSSKIGPKSSKSTWKVKTIVKEIYVPGKICNFVAK